MNIKKLAQASTLILVLSLAGCGEPPKAKPGDGTALLVLGDSLTAGYGLSNPETQAWTVLLENKWRKEGFLTEKQTIKNAGVSGETSQEGKERLASLLKQYQPKTVAIAMGGNDLRRQIPEDEVEKNLTMMVEMAKASGANVVMIDIDLPAPLELISRSKPNRAIALVAEKYNLPKASFPLALISRQKKMQSDEIHPGIEGQEVIAQALEATLKKTMSDE